MSRKLYLQLRKYLFLPSLRTLQNLTAKVSHISSGKLLKHFFKNQDERSRTCFMLIDEVYVRPSIQYHGGILFGKAENNQTALAKTLLAVMLKCIFSGAKILIRLIPVSNLIAEFQFDVVSAVCSEVAAAGARVLGCITDNNRVNQKFYSNLNVNPDTPWLAKSPVDPLLNFISFVIQYIC